MYNKAIRHMQCSTVSSLSGSALSLSLEEIGKVEPEICELELKPLNLTFKFLIFILSWSFLFQIWWQFFTLNTSTSILLFILFDEKWSHVNCFYLEKWNILFKKIQIFQACDLGPPSLTSSNLLLVQTRIYKKTFWPILT